MLIEQQSTADLQISRSAHQVLYKIVTFTDFQQEISQIALGSTSYRLGVTTLYGKVTDKLFQNVVFFHKLKVKMRYIDYRTLLQNSSNRVYLSTHDKQYMRLLRYPQSFLFHRLCVSFLDP